MKIKSILIVSNNYPTSTDPVTPFVEQLVLALSKKGIKVTVIAPFRILKHLIRGTELHPKRREVYIKGGMPVTVIQPRYLTLGGRFEKFNLWSASRAVIKAANNLQEKPDVCYGHFWHWAYSVFSYAFHGNIPLIANTSETPIILTDIKSLNDLQSFINYVKGVVCASSYCRDQSVEKSLTDEKKCIVLPNAIDNGLFYKKDKIQLRRQHGFLENDFIVAFTGWFSPQKGSDRLSDAISRLKDPTIKSFFIGGPRGDNASPSCEGILHKGRLPHEDIVDWLNMADIFVLPTLAEGSSNSIIEAMACGLPIISSNLPFNWDILNEKNSIMVDPMNVDEIANAIKALKVDKKRRDDMSKASLETAAGLTIDKRADRIIDFIESKI